MTGNSKPNFAEIFVPMLLIFIIGRLVLQTDVIMLSHLSEHAAAAFAIPTRIMILDALIAFAVAPVVSVRVSAASTSEDKNKFITEAVQFGLWGGVTVMIAGFIIYPLLISLVWGPGKSNLAALAIPATLILNFSVPIRLMQFISGMAVQGLKRGKFLLPISAFELIANAFLNWLFIFYLELGFAGSYIATALCGCLGLAATLFVLKGSLAGSFSIGKILKMPEMYQLSQFVKQGWPEFTRLVSERLGALVCLGIFSYGAISSKHLVIFSVGLELQALIFIVMITFMRASAIVWAPENAEFGMALRILKRPIVIALSLSALGSILLLLLKDAMALYIYRIDIQHIEWWNSWIIILALWIPFRILWAVVRGYLQSKQRLADISSVEIRCKWLLMIPLFFMGVYLSNPWIIWGALLLEDLISTGWLLAQRLTSNTVARVAH